jgi:hypothetical protein
MPLTKDEAWKIILAVPGAENRLWFNQPSGFLHDRFLAKVHHKEPAVTLQVGSMEMRDMMLEAEPALFYITDHYRKFPFVLIRLAALNRTVLKGIIAGRARQLAEMPPPKRAGASARAGATKKKTTKKKTVAPARKSAKKRVR